MPPILIIAVTTIRSISTATSMAATATTIILILTSLSIHVADFALIVRGLGFRARVFVWMQGFVQGEALRTPKER